MSEIRKALLQALAELSERYPSMRLGQLTCMVATLAGNHALPSDVGDTALFQAARDHYSTARDRQWAELSRVRRCLLAVLANSGNEQPEFGKWLCALTDQAQSNIYDVEDEQLLAALSDIRRRPSTTAG